MGDRTRIVQKGGAGWLFGLFAYIGAAIYFVNQANGDFWGIVLGLLKAIIWPIYLISYALTALGVS